MRDPKRALLFLQDVHSELIGVLGSGVIFLMDNGVTDWYVFVNSDHSAREHIEALLADKGKRSKDTVTELSAHPNKTQRELRAKIELN